MTRREMLIGTAATAGATLLSPSAFGAFHQDAPSIKVGLIGCGGRGSGAIRDCLAADPSIVVHAAGDVFEERVKGLVEGLEKDEPKRTQIGNRKFHGLNAYQEVINSGVDCVILTTPPGFRPIHFEAAVAAGKHVFMEKPVAVDAPGIRKVIEAGELAKKKNLTVVAGTQRRADPAYMEALKRIHDGQIGDVVALYAYWNQGGLWSVKQEPGMSDLEWQIRNWLYFTWASGDHIVEQHVHNIDVCNWAMNGHPVKATSLGGRQVRTDPLFGQIFDHFATEYEYENGVKMLSMCRQIDGCASRVSEHIVGTKGTSNASTSIKGENPWRYDGDRPNPYVEEHKRLVKSIRESTGFNEARQVAESTLTAIMGRMSAYSGNEVTWEQAFNSNVSLMPVLDWNAKIPIPEVAVPGKTAAF
jgi:myo-inositol 2-dehydrogenase/D-chiro-inositol 1-dehydrogenase